MQENKYDDAGLSETQIEVNFEMHVEDIVARLGNPNKQHVGKHLTSLYFLNYFQLGFDLGFSTNEHRLQ